MDLHPYFKKYDNVKFDNILLNNIIEIQDISEPILTPKNINTVSIPTVDGEKFNGTTKEIYEIVITGLLDCDTQKEYDDRINQLKYLFDTKEPKRFSIKDDKFCMAICISGIEAPEKITFYSSEIIIKLTVLDPYYYSTDIKLFEKKDIGEFIVQNKGKNPVKPLISVGFSKPAHFVQIQNQETGEIIKVGNYHGVNVPSVQNNEILNNPCESTSGFIDTTANIKADRSAGGTLTVTSKGNAVCMATVGSGDTTWKGVLKRINLSKTVDEFKLALLMEHNSVGKNGDPTFFEEKPESIITGSKEVFYEVTCSYLNYRTGPGTTYKTKGSITRGYKITNFTKETKGWLEWKKDGSTVYSSLKYLSKRVSDNTETVNIKNMMAYHTQGAAGGTFVYQLPEINAKKLCVVPTGEIVRVIISKKYYDNDYAFYKLAVPYKGITGYVNVKNLISSGEIGKIEHDIDYETADDKTGVIEMYGFDVNGQQLFCVSMQDNNAYYEHTHPVATIGGKEIIKEDKTVPPPKTTTTTTTTDGKTDVKVTNHLSGRYGDWNEFYGEWNISRQKVNGVYNWDISVRKIQNGMVTKQQFEKNIRDNTFLTTGLAYLVLYIGTTGTLEKSSGMALADIKLEEINQKNDDTPIVNKITFKSGDTLEIDIDNTNNVYLNGVEHNDLLDIGSRLFKLQQGETTIKVISDDENTQTSVMFREKY